MYTLATEYSGACDCFSVGMVVPELVNTHNARGGPQASRLSPDTNRTSAHEECSDDHIAGGKPFKEWGATIIAHKQAKVRLAPLADPATPLPDVLVDKKKVISLGGTTLELTHVGLNHSDSTLVMRLPREKIIFVVDLLPVGQIPARGMIDFHPIEAMESIKQILKMDWERLIPGHPGVNDRLGTKADVQDQLQFLQDASDAVKVAARDGKCWEPAEKEVRLPKYEKWPGYDGGLPFVLRRYCGLWGRGT